jgi:hypothetical protein
VLGGLEGVVEVSKCSETTKFTAFSVIMWISFQFEN